MTATTMATTTRPASEHRPGGLAAAFRAEWVKARTLRSTWVTLIGSAVMSVVLGAVVAASTVSQWAEQTPAQRADVDPTANTLVGVLFATVIVGSLGVRSVTSEYSTGMIRTTFSALPQRRRVLTAKTLVIAAVAFPVALVANLAAFVVGQSIMASEGIEASLADGSARRAILYGAIAVMATTVVGVGLGAILRRTAAATTALSVAIVGSQIFSVALPEGARKYLPGTALQAAVSGRQPADLLAATPAVLTLIAYAAVALVVAMALIGRRDA